MSPMDEAATLRRRMDDLEAAVGALARKAGGPPPALVLKVQAPPATAQEFVSVKAVDIDGDEVEGAVVSLVATGAAFPAANVGTKKPPTNTCVIGELVGGFWTFQYDGVET